MFAMGCVGTARKLGEFMKIDLEEVEKALQLIERINETPLAEIEFVRAGKPVEGPGAKTLELWERLQLSNWLFVRDSVQEGAWIQLDDGKESDHE